MELALNKQQLKLSAKVIQLCGSIVLLVVLWKVSDREKLASTLQNADLTYFSAAIFVLVLALLLSSTKWWLMMSSMGLRFSFLRTYALYLASTFWSMFLPTSIGGDALRVMILSQASRSPGPVIASTLYERGSGLAALLAIGISSGYTISGLEFGKLSLYLIAAAVLCLTIFACANSSWLAKDKRISSFLDRFVLKISTKCVIAVFFLSIFKAILFCIEYYLLAKSIGSNAQLTHFLVAVPVVAVAKMVPVSLNGIGLGESALVTVLGTLGESHEAALSTGILALGAQIIVSLLGGIIACLVDFSPASWGQTSKSPALGVPQ